MFSRDKVRHTRLVCLMLAGALVLLVARSAYAHAKLIKANPAPNSVLAEAPPQVQLWFDEPIELAFSEIQVLDIQRQRVDTGTLQHAPDDPKSILVPLKASGAGSYTVVWKVLSAADGHFTRGVFAYGVGGAAGPAVAPIDQPPYSSEELTPLTALVRWASLFSLLVLVGSLAFRPLILEPSFSSISAERNARPVGIRRWRQLGVICFGLFFAASLGELVVQASLISSQPTIGNIVSFLTGSRLGFLWLIRTGLVGICAVLVSWNERRTVGPVSVWIPVVLGEVALSTRALASHAAYAGNFSLPVFADWVHLTGVSLWVGGLACIVWVVPAIWRELRAEVRGAWVAWLVPQFSKVAIASTAAILVTGIINSFVQIPALDFTGAVPVPTLEQLAESAYNNILALKIALFVVMVAFGAVNLLILSPRFRRASLNTTQSNRLFSRLRVNVTAEVVLGTMAVFLAGLLTLTPPPRSEPVPDLLPVVETPAPRPVILLGSPTPNTRVRFEIGPSLAQPSSFDVRVTDEQGNVLSDIQRVFFNFTYLNDDTGTQNVQAEPRGDGHYAAQGTYMPLEGMWRIKVIVRRRGLEDASVDFPVYIPPPVIDEVPVAVAQLALKRSQGRMNRLRSLRSVQQLNDGAGGLAVSKYDYIAPDKTRFVIEGQTESVAIGSKQYYQTSDGQWIERERVEPFSFPAFDFAATAQGTRFGRSERLSGNVAEVILFHTPNTSGTDWIHYAYWVAKDDGRVLQLAMVAKDHYMMQHYFDFDSPAVAIEAPPDAVPAPTPAPVTSSGALDAAAQGPARPQGVITGDLQGDGALVMVAAGVVVLLLGSGGNRSRRARLTLAVIGAASVLVGLGLFVDAVNATMSASQNVPVNMTRAQSGQLVYRQYCQGCHGEKGYGDGPDGASLPVKPFDLTTHVLLHDEQYLHATILNGRGYMPAFGSRLSQDQILDVIAYTRLLAREAQTDSKRPAVGFTPQP